MLSTASQNLVRWPTFIADRSCDGYSIPRTILKCDLLFVGVDTSVTSERYSRSAFLCPGQYGSDILEGCEVLVNVSFRML